MFYGFVCRDIVFLRILKCLTPVFLDPCPASMLRVTFPFVFPPGPVLCDPSSAVQYLVYNFFTSPSTPLSMSRVFFPKSTLGFSTHLGQWDLGFLLPFRFTSAAIHSLLSQLVIIYIARSGYSCILFWLWWLFLFTIRSPRCGSFHVKLVQEYQVSLEV